MASYESQIMTNVIADPQVRTTVGEKHARQRVDICRLAIPDAAVAGDIFRLTKLKAHDRLIRMARINDANAGLTGINIGIYTPSPDDTDPVVIDNDVLVNNVSFATVAVSATEILGLGLTNPEDYGKAIWEYAGVATEPEPGTEYEICMTCTGNPVASDFTLIVEYTAGD